MKKILIVLLTAFSLAASGQGDLQMKYLGTAGWEIKDGNVTVLVDPYISRLKLGTGPSIHPDDDRKSYARSDYFEPDSAKIDEIIGEVDFILVHHSHFDHISDVPYIAKKTGAKVIATETGINMLRAYGIPNDQLYPVRGGEDYQFENFSVRVIPGIHSALNEKHYIDSRRYTEPPEAPMKISEFIEGGSLQFLARFDSHTVMTAGSMNYVEREIQGIHPDILVPGVNMSQRGLYKYTERLLKATGNPKIVIPTHWDNFRLPYGFSQESAVENKLKPFVEEVKEFSPESRVIIPVHLETITIKPQK